MRIIHIKLFFLFSIFIISVFGGKSCFCQNIQDNRNPYHLGITQTVKDYENQVKDWMPNKRAIGLLGDRVSGAILFNGKDPSEKKVRSTLRRPHR